MARVSPITHPEERVCVECAGVAIGAYNIVGQLRTFYSDLEIVLLKPAET